jgi:hypothetical protein
MGPAIDREGDSLGMGPAIDREGDTQKALKYAVPHLTDSTFKSDTYKDDSTAL